jgi:hypothetical protein
MSTLKLVPPTLPAEEITYQAALDAVEPHRAALEEAARRFAREAPIAVSCCYVCDNTADAADDTDAVATAEAIVRERIGDEAFGAGGRRNVDECNEQVNRVANDIALAAVRAREAELAAQEGTAIMWPAGTVRPDF